jgi:hypothetical protein
LTWSCGAPEIKRGLFGPGKRRGFPFDCVVHDAPHEVEPALGARPKHLAAPPGRPPTNGGREREVELLAILDLGFGSFVVEFHAGNGCLGRSIDCVFHLLTIVLFFHASIMVRWVGQVLGNPCDFSEILLVRGRRLWHERCSQRL